MLKVSIVRAAPQTTGRAIVASVRAHTIDPGPYTPEERDMLAARGERDAIVVITEEDGCPCVYIVIHADQEHP